MSQVVKEGAAAAKEDRPGAVAAAQIAQAEAAEKAAVELAAAELAEKECRVVLAGLLEQASGGKGRGRGRGSSMVGSSE